MPDARMMLFFETIEDLLGETARSTLATLYERNGGDDWERLQRGLVKTGLFGLRGFGDEEYKADTFGVPADLRAPHSWNVFHDNPHACMLAAVALSTAHQPTNTQGITSRDALAQVVTRYLATIHRCCWDHADAYRRVVDRIEGEGGDGEAITVNRFGELAMGFITTINSDPVRDLAQAIKVVLDAFLWVREQREETIPLTLDLSLPLFAHWDLIHHLMAIDPEERGQDPSTSLTAITGRPFADIRAELEDAGKHLGRGIARIQLNPDAGNDQPVFVLQKRWSNHDGAPLGVIYGLQQDSARRVQTEILPEDRGKSVEMVLDPMGTISVRHEEEPLLDYLLGSWRYVDLVTKARLIANGFNNPDSMLLAPIYRMLATAYQLGYHHHGSTLSIDFHEGEIPEIADQDQNHLVNLRNRWGLQEQVGTVGLRHPGTHYTRRDAEDDDRQGNYVLNGRLSYALTLQDGLSRWAVPTRPDEGPVLRDFHAYRTLMSRDAVLQDTAPEVTVQSAYDARRTSMGLPTNRFKMGARHSSAWQESVEGPDKLVLCVSQDGYIEAYQDGYILRVR